MDAFFFLGQSAHCSLGTICHCISSRNTESKGCAYAWHFACDFQTTTTKNLQDWKSRELDYLGKHVENCKKWSK